MMWEFLVDMMGYSRYCLHWVEHMTQPRRSYRSAIHHFLNWLHETFLRQEIVSMDVCWLGMFFLNGLNMFKSFCYPVLMSGVSHTNTRLSWISHDDWCDVVWPSFFWTRKSGWTRKAQGVWPTKNDLIQRRWGFRYRTRQKVIGRTYRNQ